MPVKAIFASQHILRLLAYRPRLTYTTRGYTRRIDSTILRRRPCQLDSAPTVGIACRDHWPNYGNCH